VVVNIPKASMLLATKDAGKKCRSLRKKNKVLLSMMIKTSSHSRQFKRLRDHLLRNRRPKPMVLASA
jgi:hypothetical protein